VVYVTGRESVEDIFSLFVPFAPESESGDHRSLSADARREKVARLLEVAEAHAAVGRLWEPPGSNAYEAYKLVLQYDPGNEPAARAVQQLEQQKSRAEDHTSVQ
jgi:hypothetical protein